MAKFPVAVWWMMYGTFHVEADNLEEAVKKVSEGTPPHNGMPEKAEYVEDSLEIDRYWTNEMNSVSDEEIQDG